MAILYTDRGSPAPPIPKSYQLTNLRLDDNQLTDVKGLEKLSQLEVLYLINNKLTSVKGLESAALPQAAMATSHWIFFSSLLWVGGLAGAETRVALARARDASCRQAALAIIRRPM